MLLEFLLITLLEFYSKNYSKSYSNYYHYFSIIIILLTLFRMRRGQERPPFGFLFVIFFSVRATTSNFSQFSFCALRRFFSQFSGLYSVFLSKTIQNRMKKVPKKAKKTHDFLKIESDKKEHIKLPFFFCWKVSYYLGLKAWKVSSERLLWFLRDFQGVVSDPHPTLVPPSHTQSVYTEAMRNSLFFNYFI